MLVSSRNWPPIENSLDVTSIQFSLELNAEAISATVGSYIEYKVAELAYEKRYTEAIRTSVLTHLRANANDTFLWVALVCQELSEMETTDRGVMEILNSFPAGLYPCMRV